jgi:hypothetical protein
MDGKVQDLGNVTMSVVQNQLPATDVKKFVSE